MAIVLQLLFNYMDRIQDPILTTAKHVRHCTAARGTEENASAFVLVESAEAAPTWRCNAARSNTLNMFSIGSD